MVIQIPGLAQWIELPYYVFKFIARNDGNKMMDFDNCIILIVSERLA
jgi:hypothetical protein